MQALLPLAWAIPLLAAAVLLAIQSVTRRFWQDAVAVTAAVASTGCSSALVVYTAQRPPLVYWCGGWQPRGGDAVGIAMMADVVSSSLALLVALLTTASFVFSWRYFRTVKALFHALLLMFAGAMVAFCYAADIFTLFVFFEFMSVTGYALTAYQPEEAGPLQGALNFAVTNSIGGFLMLSGIALVYGRTGVLNLAQIGERLAGHPADLLVLVSFTLIASGLLVKAALVPFHFAFADAHAVAPIPVSVLFSGVMIELGIYGVARVYWDGFSGAVPAHAVGFVFMVLGTVGCLFGALMCFLQIHLKRLLAFSSISHSGLFLIGLGLMKPHALAAVVLYVLSHGLTKAALFMCVGVLLHRLGRVNELHLHGRGRHLALTGGFMVAGALALAGVPPFGTSLSKSLLDHTAEQAGQAWLVVVAALCSVLTAGAVLRAAGRVFLGLGPSHDELLQVRTLAEEPEQETAGSHHHSPWPMLAPIIALLLGALLLGCAPSLNAPLQAGAERFVDRTALANYVLRAGPPPPLPPTPPHRHDVQGLALSMLALVGAVLLALFALARHPHTRAQRALDRPYLLRAAAALKLLHSGHVGEYVVWLVGGVLVLGGLLLVVAR